MPNDLNQTLMQLLQEQQRPQPERELVEAAFEFAFKMHDGQLRKNGEPYIIHPVAVACILAQVPADTTTVCSALLHDVLEDTHAKPEEIKALFGPEVLKIVEGVTKLGKFQFDSKEERNAENFRRMFLAMANDVRIILLKLGDRLHNMRTLEHLPREKQIKKAHETLDVFAPLANRMGMGKWRAELEDLSLKFLDPDEYQMLVDQVERHKDAWQGSISQMQQKIGETLTQLEIEARIYGRVKNFYSIYKKIKGQGKSLEDVYDIGALRIIVSSEKECYEALGVIHSQFRLLPGRFKDYIGMPKSNLYQSLHTTVIGPLGRPIEVQIRTHEMHRLAEYGIAAHWRYKESGGSVTASSDEDQQLSWLKQMLELKDESQDAQEYVDNVKLDLFRDEVFVFTPRGDLFDLPKGATPVDFAYRVHTHVGHTCTGAKVNGKIVTLDTALRNGDIVEIMTSKKAQPRLDWIKFVQTQHARSAIRQWFKKNFREDHVDQGRMLIEAELSRAAVDELVKNGTMADIAAQLNYHQIDDMYMALGYGEITLARITNRVKKDKKEDKLPDVTNETTSVSAPSKPLRRKTGASSDIEGLQGMLYHLAKCCAPLPGDGICGVVTRSRGVMVHREDCINLGHVNPERIMEVSWTAPAGTTVKEAGQKKTYHGVRLDVQVIDRVGIFKDVLTRIADINTNVSNARVKMLNNNTALIEVTVDIADLEHLEKVRRVIAKLSDVISVSRTQVRPLNKKTD